MRNVELLAQLLESVELENVFGTNWHAYSSFIMYKPMTIHWQSMSMKFQMQNSLVSMNLVSLIGSVQPCMSWQNQD